MTDKELAEKVFHMMYDNDPFSQWLGMEPVLIDKGHCVLKMKIREEMLNGFSIMHGGVSYSLADSAFAFAANSYGKIAVSTSIDMQYPETVNKGDIITAEAKTVTISEKKSTLDVVVRNQEDVIVGLFRGTVYRTSKDWI